MAEIVSGAGADVYDDLALAPGFGRGCAIIDHPS